MNEPTLARWLRYLIYSSGLIPLVIFAQFLSPFHFGKVIVLRTIVQVMAVLYVLLVLRDRSYLPKPHPALWAFFAFTVAFTLTSFTGVAFLQSWWGTLERMGGLFTFWHYFIFFVITVSVMREREHWKTLLDLAIAAGVVSALYGLLQKTHWALIIGADGRPRPFGTIGNPALFAGYEILTASAAALLFSLRSYFKTPTVGARTTEQGGILVGIASVVTLLTALIFKDHGFWVVPVGIGAYGVFLMFAGRGSARMLYGSSAVVMMLAAVTTAVRGSLVAIVAEIFVCLVLWVFLNHSRRAKSLLFGALTALCLFVFFAFLLRDSSLVTSSGYLKRITDFSPNNYTVQTRFWAWSAGLQGWSESPQRVLLGWGPENFNIPFSKHFNPKFFTGPGAETFFDRAHNQFVEMLVTMGVVGFVSYLALFVASFWTYAQLMKRSGDERVIGTMLTATTVAYMIHNAFIFDTSANFLVFFTLLAFGVVVYRGFSEQQVSTRPLRAVSWSGAQQLIAVVLSVGALILIYRTAVLPVKANYATTRAIVAGWTGDFVRAVDKFQESINYDTAGRYEFRHRFAQFLLENDSTENRKIPQYGDGVQQAIVAVEANVKENPQDYLPLLYLARLHLILGKDDPKSPHNDIGLDYTQRALAISPTFVRTYYEVAQAYLNKRDIVKAQEWFEKARVLAPHVGITYWYLAAIEFERGNRTKGLQLVKEAIDRGYGLSESESLRLVQEYVAAGDSQSIVKVYQNLVSVKPTNPQYWASLAVAYAQVGRISDAVNATRQAIALAGNDSAFRAEAEAFLRQLGATP